MEITTNLQLEGMPDKDKAQVLKQPIYWRRMRKKTYWRRRRE